MFMCTLNMKYIGDFNLKLSDRVEDLLCLTMRLRWFVLYNLQPEKSLVLLIVTRT
jgi:hypothetical protein